MINTAWMAIILFGIAGLTACLTRIKIENWFAFAVFMVVAVLYAFAFAGKPVWGYQTVRLMGAAAMVVSAVMLLKKRELRRTVFTPGAAVFAAAMAAAWWAHRGQVYIQQDEFTHWGRAVSQLYQLNVLPSTVPGALDYPSYPPGSTLLYAFWCWLGGAFSEGITITGANVFVIACVMPLMQFASWKQWRRIVPLTLVCLMLPLIYYAGAYQDIYVDVLLGCIAAYALMAWFLMGSCKASQLMICAAVLVLPLVKASGTVLAAMVLVIVALDQPRGAKRSVRPVILPAIFLVAGALSWSLFTHAHGIVSEKTFHAQDILTNIQHVIRGTSPWSQKYQFYNFFRFITMPQMMGKGHILQLSCVEWVLLYTAVACWISRRAKEDVLAQRCSRLIWMLLAALAVYAVMLYHLYLYTFDAWEAAGLHSFDRYMGTMMTVLAVVTVCLLLKHWQNYPLKPLPSTMALAMSLILFVQPLLLAEWTFSAPYAMESNQILRSEMVPSYNSVKHPQAGDRVAWMAETQVSDNEFLPYIVNRYEFYPAQVERPFANLMRETTAEQIRQTLVHEKYDYVYCYTVNEEFISKYASLFAQPEEICAKTLYRVEVDGEDVRLLGLD